MVTFSNTYTHYCLELNEAPVKRQFHLALKKLRDAYPVALPNKEIGNVISGQLSSAATVDCPRDHLCSFPSSRHGN